MIPGDSKVGLVRKFAAIVLASAFVVSVAACSDLPAQVQGCVPTITSGTASDSISASGAIGTKPKVHVPSPTVSSKEEVSAITKGTGLELGKDDIAEISAILYDGATGKVVGATDSSSAFTKSGQIQLAVGDSSKELPSSVTKALECQRVGSRLAIVLSASQIYGSASTATEQGFNAKQTMVLVTDIGGGYRGRATGILQPLQSGFPSVVTSGNGTPGLTLDLQEPPKTPQHELIRGGSGAVVKAGEKVLLQLQVVAWTDPAPKTTVDSTWNGDLAPRFYTLTALKKNSGGYALDSPSVKALVGQRVGSQVLVVVPPKYGFAAGKQPTGYPAGDTLIYVYDILGTY